MSYEYDEMFTEPNDSDIPFVEYLYDDHDAFYGEDSSSYHPDADHEIASQFDEDNEELEDNWDDSFDDSMDGDAESAFGSCGWGVDEYYNSDCDYGDDW